MDPNEKINLTKEQETLLIVLYAKAQPNPILKDEKAQEILAQVNYDFAGLKVPEKTQVTLRVRAKQLDEWTRDFLRAHPHGVVIHLGCGLDSRCMRVSPPPEADWYDLDLPDVIQLRRKFYPESEHYHLLSSSVTELSWMEAVAAGERAVFVVAEGLLMYLDEDQVQALFRRLHERFPGVRLICDVFSQLTADRVKAHPSLAKTGAQVRWGIDDPHEIERWVPGIRLQQEWFFSQSPDLGRLGLFYRLMFKLTSGLQVAQRAHRLLDFTL